MLRTPLQSFNEKFFPLSEQIVQVSIFYAPVPAVAPGLRGRRPGGGRAIRVRPADAASQVLPRPSPAELPPPSSSSERARRVRGLPGPGRPILREGRGRGGPQEQQPTKGGKRRGEAAAKEEGKYSILLCTIIAILRTFSMVS